MTEEEYFRKNYPDSCYGDKPLSPHFDFFQAGVEFGEQQSEEKIQELKIQLKTAYRKGMRHLAKALKYYDRTEGAWTDYFEHTVDRVLKQELEKLK